MIGSSCWGVGLILATTLVFAGALGVPLPGTARWLVRISGAAPAVMLTIASLAALPLAARTRHAAATLVAGSAAAAAWTAWLSAYLFDDRATRFGLTSGMLAYLFTGTGALTVALIVRAGASTFRLLIVLIFTYLSFQAIRNINLFGLVAGAVLTWNVSEWIAKLQGGRTPPVWEWIAPAVVAGLVTLWAVGVVTDRYYILMGDIVRFGLRERALTFGHKAARFAGRQGLPTRALVFDLGQTGVYVYHNGPERKVFMDARLELPSLSTFQTYVRIEEWLNHNDPRWDAEIARLGDPLVLISHDGWAEAEAALLSHPRWRCIYYDEIASVFVTRTGPSSSHAFPDHDFMAWHLGAGSEASGTNREEFDRRGERTRPTEPRREETRRRPVDDAHTHLDPRVRADPGDPLARTQKSCAVVAAARAHSMGGGARPDASTTSTFRPVGPSDRPLLGPRDLLFSPRSRGKTR